MKVLIVSFAFPPSNVIGAVRIGKLARYLDRRGHDLRVLTAEVGDDLTLPLEIARERVLYTEYREHAHWPDRVAQLLRRSRAQPDQNGPATAASRRRPAAKSVRQTLRRHYFGLIHVPDLRTDWRRTAIPAGCELIKKWKPDIIFASAPPHTGLIVASRLARAYDIPWVADFRDLWSDNPYYSQPRWRRPVDAILERRVLRHAAGLVTVSPIWAEQLRRRHGKTADVVYNGYAAEDFPPHPPSTETGAVLTIRYLGSIYLGFRDPSPLFAAVALLPERLRACIKVEFFSDEGDAILDAAAAHGVATAVAIMPRVPYRQALERQMEADILLSLQSSDRRDEGNLPAKLFEYLYARRPILLLGYEFGIAARLVVERNAGLVSNRPADIRDHLQLWLEAKQAGRLGRLDPSVSSGLGRDDQYAKLERLFEEVLEARGAEARSGAAGTALH
jgi:glycosyltransferase involved in cell wall biosynthesis